MNYAINIKMDLRELPEEVLQGLKKESLRQKRPIEEIMTDMLNEVAKSFTPNKEDAA